MSTKSINVPILARVEGEGALEIDIKDNKIERLDVRIYEPPRFYEKFLEGREYGEIMDITARICGICPIAYQMSAAHAVEGAFGLEPSQWVADMRRLFYCGEWLQSHALHVHLLAAPDFLGFNSAIEMAKKFPAEVTRGVRLQTLGNHLIKFLGERSVHPVGACVGGFYRAPTEKEAKAMLEELKANLQDTIDMVHWIGSVETPKFKHDVTFVALRHEEHYPLDKGRLVSNRGLDIDISEFNDHFREEHVPHSTSLHSFLDDKPYLVGPLSRFNLNFDKLPKEVQDLAKEVGLEAPSQNMFDSMLIRAIEMYYSVLEAIRILENYAVPAEGPRLTNIQPKAGWGYGCTEAPRGICWHRYEFDDQGLVKFAQIVPPTSQNYARIEQDLKQSIEEFGLEQSDEEIRLLGEMIIRNYDPCISCSVHFLDLRVNRK